MSEKWFGRATKNNNRQFQQSLRRDYSMGRGLPKTTIPPATGLERKVQRMSRLVIFLGILLIVAGAAGFLFGIIGVPVQFTNMISQAVSPTAAELCNPGETLD